MRTAALLAMAALFATGSAPRAEPVRLLAAGSLKAALTDLGQAFTRGSGAAIAGSFGPSGLLRERILGGEEADLFAAANLEHPTAIAVARGIVARSFARNTLCALTRPQLRLEGDGLLSAMLDPGIKVGTSTPGADPSGDRAWELFDRAEALRAGSAGLLKAKALQLTGNAFSTRPGDGRSVYARMLEDGRADIFLTWRTNAARTAAELPGLRIVDIPAPLAVGADYGLVVLGGRAEAVALADFIHSAEGQAILASHGFAPPLRTPT